jgi:biotin carboxyl carrier protein
VLLTFEIQIGEKAFRVSLTRRDSGWVCRVDDRELAADFAPVEPGVLSLLLDGRSFECRRDRSAGETVIWVAGTRYVAEVRDPRSLRSRRAAAGRGDGPVRLIAPMPGKVVRVLAAENTAVRAGQGILVVEAMKMQNELKSPKDGVVQKILAAEGAAVNAGDALAIVE